MPSDPSAVYHIDIVVLLLRQKGLEDAARWMTTPRAELEGLTPEDALACGRRAEVQRLIGEEGNLRDLAMQRALRPHNNRGVRS